MANIQMPDDVITKEMIQTAQAVVYEAATEAIRDQITPDMPQNMIQDLKTRKVEEMGFQVLDENGEDLVAKMNEIEMPDNNQIAENNDED